MRPILLVAVILSLALASCGKLQDPVFNSISNFKIARPGLTKSLVTMDVEYYNPNKQGGKLKEAQGEVWVDSSYLGHFHVDTLINVPPRANFTVPAKLDVDMKYLLKYTMTGFKNDEVLLTIKGNAKVGKSGFYKKFSINYEGKQNLGALMK